MTSPAITLEQQRKVTAAFIADDPTTAQLIPQTRVKTSTGGFSDIPGTPRLPQTFKLSLQAYDQRPTVTIAGVERAYDYHLIGPHDMQAEVGDFWFDGDTRYEIIGFTEGWDYMVKAIVVRTVPREGKP